MNVMKCVLVVTYNQGLGSVRRSAFRVVEPL